MKIELSDKEIQVINCMADGWIKGNACGMRGGVSWNDAKNLLEKLNLPIHPELNKQISLVEASKKESITNEILDKACVTKRELDGYISRTYTKASLQVVGISYPLPKNLDSIIKSKTYSPQEIRKFITGKQIVTDETAKRRMKNRVKKMQEDGVPFNDYNFKTERAHLNAHYPNSYRSFAKRFNWPPENEPSRPKRNNFSNIKSIFNCDDCDNDSMF